MRDHPSLQRRETKSAQDRTFDSFRQHAELLLACTFKTPVVRSNASCAYHRGKTRKYVVVFGRNGWMPNRRIATCCSRVSTREIYRNVLLRDKVISEARNKFPHFHKLRRFRAKRTDRMPHERSSCGETSRIPVGGDDDRSEATDSRRQVGEAKLATHEKTLNECFEANVERTHRSSDSI